MTRGNWMLRELFTAPESPPTVLSERARLEAAIAAEEARQAEHAAATAEEQARLPRLREALAAVEWAEQQTDGRARVEALARDMETYHALMRTVQGKLQALASDVSWLAELETRIRAERKALVLDSRALEIDGPAAFEPGDILAFSHATLSRAWSRGVEKGERA
jgi:hypothetical protein